MVSLCKVNMDSRGSSASKKRDLKITFGNVMSRSSSQPSFLLPPRLTLTPVPVYSSVLSSPAQGVERFENEPPTEVLSFLFVGNAKDSTDVELLRKLGIGHIVSVTTSPPPECGSHTTTTTTGTAFNHCSSNNSTSNDNSRLGDQSSSSSSATCRTSEDEFKKFHIPVLDNLSDNLAPYFDAACEFIGKSY